MNRLLLLPLLAAGPLTGGDVRLRLVDEARRPVAGATAFLIFTTPEIGGERIHEGRTDRAGRFAASGTALGPVLVRARAPGHYPVDAEIRSADEPVDAVFILRRMVRPVPLHVRRLTFGRHSADAPPTPEGVAEEYGVDLERGDLVAPHGQGVRADLRVRMTGECLGWREGHDERARFLGEVPSAGPALDQLRFFHGRWRGRLEVSFPDPGSGIIEVREGYLPYSGLKLPHAAPEDGYAPGLVLTCETGAPCGDPPDAPARGFFLRVRPGRDATGRPVFHYAKLITGLHFDPRGRAGFTVHFNPVPGDRNLEFDPARNLLPEVRPEPSVVLP